MLNWKIRKCILYVYFMYLIYIIFLKTVSLLVLRHSFTTLGPNLFIKQTLMFPYCLLFSITRNLPNSSKLNKVWLVTTLLKIIYQSESDFMGFKKLPYSVLPQESHATTQNLPLSCKFDLEEGSR